MTGLGGSATGEIEAPIEQVWAVVSDVGSIAEWQDGVLTATAVERDADGQVVLAEIVSDAKVKELKVRARFAREAPNRLSWVVESGDVKKLDGAWILEDLGDGRTRATYEVEVDPGRMLRMLVRGPVEDAVRQKLVGQRPAELAARVAAL